MDISGLEERIDQLLVNLEDVSDLQPAFDKIAQEIVDAEKTASGLKSNHIRIDWKGLRNDIGVIIRNRWISLWKDRGTNPRFRKSKNYAYCGMVKAQPFWEKTADPYIDGIYNKIHDVFEEKISKSVK